MFESADRRLFDGHQEDYLADFGSRALGSDRFPFLRAVDSVVGIAIGQPGYKVNLGGLKANGQLTVGTGIIGAAIGLTRQLTVFANIPFVTMRVKARLAEDSLSGDAGFNPAHPALGNSADQSLANQFFASFNSALDNLNAQIAAGNYTGAQLVLAQSIAARGTRIRDGLAAITNSPEASAFLPTSSSATGVALINAIRGLQDTLSGNLGVNAGFTQDPVLAGPRLSQRDVTGFLSNSAGPIDALPLQGATISRMGDMDVGAVLTLVDRFDQIGKSPGGFRLAIEGKLKLPTGLRDNPNNLLHPGTGNGRYELGLTGTADVAGGSVGARFIGGYTRKFEALRVRRVTSPDQPYPEFTRLTNVNYKAGDVLQLGAQPFLRLARNFALHGSASYWREATGNASYYRTSDSIPGVSASILVEDGGRRAFTAGGGFSYVGRAVNECMPGNKCGWPIDASWTYTQVVAASGGRVPQLWSTQIQIRWYQRLWR